MHNIVNHSLNYSNTMLSITKVVFPFAVMALLSITSLAYADTIKIGLRAHHGIEKSMQQWKATADYLSEKIPDHKFIMVPFVGLRELMEEAAKNRFDFVLTNPSSYVEMEVRYGASAILTLRNKRQGKPYTQFGAVIFTKKDRDDINRIEDLKDKRIIAVSERAFGGWRVACGEFLKHDFHPKKEARQVSFSGGIQQDVVNIVALGNADVGVVRTDMLERMDQSGLINIDDFKIINSKTSPGFPFMHSTALYPEWPFAKMRNTSEELSRSVALALLTMPAEHPAAMAGKYVGWTTAEDYQPVHDLMKLLRVGPYVDYHGNETAFEHFLEQYKYHTIVVFFVLVGLIIFSSYVLSLNKKILTAKAEQERLNDELELRVEERTKELLVAKNQAEEASRAKSEFLSKMSHELRTPLNAVLGFAQIIEIDAEESGQPELNKKIKEILHAGRYLLDFINDVLDFAKIESGKYDVNIQPVQVTNVVNEVLGLMQTQAKEKKVLLTKKITEDKDLKVLADQRSLKQVLINIISNAIKYNRSGGSVDVAVMKQNNEFCVVSVTDTGEGIAEESLQIIFDPFQRVTNRTQIEGTGVGLAITDSLVNIMGGKINVESTPGQGSTFSVLLKLAN